MKRYTSAVPPIADLLSAVAVLAQREGRVPRARLSERAASTLAAQYLTLADAAPDEGVRLALRADAIRLLDGARGLARAAELQAVVVRGVSHVDVDADLRFLAWLNWVELRHHARQQRLGMPPPDRDDVDAIEGLLAASTSLSAPFPGLLALELLAAALWARAAWGRLPVVVDALVERSPIRWRTALHRAHLALATGADAAAASALADAQAAALPDELQAYVWGVLAGLAAKRGDSAEAARSLAARRAAGSFLPDSEVQVPAWCAPTFVFAEEPRYELAIELWRRVDGGHAHAQFVARRLLSMDPQARWRRMQASELGVAPAPARRAARGAPAVDVDDVSGRARGGRASSSAPAETASTLVLAPCSGKRKTRQLTAVPRRHLCRHRSGAARPPTPEPRPWPTTCRRQRARRGRRGSTRCRRSRCSRRTCR